ncbi:MAG TPA: TatD family hydrolase, partial [Solirubrobacterales bacterium]|nr:TatD family hydrolase [Solirubrobacterales bacterium]
MIDSHTHLFLCEGEEEELVAAAAGAGVVRMLTVGMNAETNAGAVASTERYGAVFAAVGRHPNEASGFDD